MAMKVDEFRSVLEGELADAPLVDPATWATVVRRGHRLRRIRRAAVVTSLGLVLAGMLGLVVLGGLSNEPATVMTSDSPAAPPSTPAQIEGGPAAGLYLLADPEPKGLPLILRAGPLDEGGNVTTGDGTIRFQRWVRLNDADRTPEATFDLQWGASPSFQAEVSALLEEGDPVTVRETDGRYVAQLGALVWEEPSAGYVMLASQELDAEQLVDIADLLAARDGGFSFGESPAGFEVVFDGDAAIALGGAVRRVAYGDGTRGFGLFLTEQSEYQPGLNLQFPEARVVGVRGRDAVLTPRAFAIPGNSLTTVAAYLVTPDWVLQWQEGDTLISATATGLPADALIAFANSLETVDYTTWQSTAPT
jgi:hypothetical protein